MFKLEESHHVSVGGLDVGVVAAGPGVHPGQFHVAQRHSGHHQTTDHPHDQRHSR